MKHNQRGISAHFFHDLKEGILSQITKECKLNRELLFIRDGYVNVYHQGRSLLKIEEKERSENYRLSFNFNYARYQENWPDLLKQLQQLRFELTKPEDKISDRELFITIPFDGDFSACESSLAILRGLIEDFIKPCEHTIPKYDYFKAHDGLEQPLRQQPIYLEKQRQQEIALANRCLGNGYCIYDMEYTQPRNSKAEENLGRYDFIALRHQAEKPTALTFIELKSTKAACDGKCGIEKHEKDLQKYLRTETAKQRINEAEKIIRQLSDLGLLAGTTPDSLPENLPLQLLFVFTDDAKRYSKRAKYSVEVGEENGWRIG